MKTLQEVMRQVDAEAVARCYFEIDPILYTWPEYRLDQTVRHIRDHIHSLVLRLIQQLRTIDIHPLEDGQQGILYAHRAIERGQAKLVFDLVMSDELLAEGVTTSSYAYEWLDREQIAGFLVADLPLTQANLERLMADVLYEASFDGFYPLDGPEDQEEPEESEQDAPDSGEEETYALPPPPPPPPAPAPPPPAAEKHAEDPDGEKNDKMQEKAACWVIGKLEDSITVRFRERQLGLLIERLLRDQDESSS